jgi:histone H2B
LPRGASQWRSGLPLVRAYALAAGWLLAQGIGLSMAKAPKDRTSAAKKHSCKGAKKAIKRTKGGKRRKKADYSSFAFYVHKVLKQVHPDVTMSKKSMSIMNSFVRDMLERLMTEGTRLIRYNRRKTLGSREVQASARLVLPSGLAKHAISEGTKAVAKYGSG